MTLPHIPFQSELLPIDFDDPRCFAVQTAYAKSYKPWVIPMNSLVCEALQRLPRKSEWVFTKPNGTPYTAVVCDAIEGGWIFGFIPRRHNEKAKIVAGSIEGWFVI